MPALGIEHTDKIVATGQRLISIATTRLADGFQFSDLTHFIPALLGIGDVIESAEHVLPEMLDLDHNEIMQLVGYVKGATDDIRIQYIVTGVLFLFAGIAGFIPQG